MRAEAASHLRHPTNGTRLSLEVEEEVDGEVDVNLVGPGGRTALHLAVRGGRADLVSLLVRHGADAGVRDEEGNTPMDIAAGSDNDQYPPNF